MSDGGRWNEPAAPEGWQSTPEPVPPASFGPGPRYVADASAPVPLPLPPGAVGAGPRRSGRTAIVVAIVVMAVLVMCGLTIAGVAWLAVSDPFGDTSSGTPAGVMASQWAGGNRYAVVEYVSAGVDGTTSIVAWDSVTRSIFVIDGFRLVATEPSSTQVWLTRAVGYSVASPQPQTPWDEASWGPPISDGPGEAWSWDTAAPDAPPVLVEKPKWRPWTGPSGWTAILSVDPEVGLWPHEISFLVKGRTIEAAIPDDTATFLPVGWSPSGRYFAYVDENQWGGLEGNVTILDATDGSVTASYETSGDPMGEVFQQLDGAVWDPAIDAVWVAASTADGSENVDISVFSLDADGTRMPVSPADSTWGDEVFGTTVIGSHSGGILLLVESAAGQTVWRIADGSATKVGPIGTGDYFGVHQNSYREDGGLLVQTYRENGPALSEDANTVAAVIDLDGENLRYIWPQE